MKYDNTKPPRTTLQLIESWEEEAREILTTTGRNFVFDSETKKREMLATERAHALIHCSHQLRICIEEQLLTPNKRKQRRGARPPQPKN